MTDAEQFKMTYPYFDSTVAIDIACCYGTKEHYMDAHSVHVILFHDNSKLGYCLFSGYIKR